MTGGEPSRSAIRRFSSTRGNLVLLAGVLVPPAAWMLDLLVLYSLERYVCRTGASWLFHATSVALLLPVIATGWAAWRAWRELGESTETADGGTPGRSRFLALWGMAFSLAFALLIVAEWIPTLVLDPCGGGILVPVR